MNPFSKTDKIDSAIGQLCIARIYGWDGRENFFNSYELFRIKELIDHMVNELLPNYFFRCTADPFLTDRIKNFLFILF